MPLPENKTTDAATGFRQHPLKHFKGLLNDINEDIRLPGQNSTKPQTFIKFEFADIEVIEANEPYPFPTTDFEVMEMNVPFSQWEVLKESIRNCGGGGSLNNLIGKHMELQWKSAILSQRKIAVDENGEQIRDDNGRLVFAEGYENREGYCWQIVDIEGVENTSDLLLQWTVNFFAEGGRNAEQFKASFMAEPSLRSLTNYGEVVQLVMSNNYLPPLIASGVLVQQPNGDITKA